LRKGRSAWQVTDPDWFVACFIFGAIAFIITDNLEAGSGRSMECPVCATENSTEASHCGKCHTPLPGFNSSETLNDATKVWSETTSPPKTKATAAGEDFGPGTVLADRYEIIALVGQGGMGAVYKARDTELDRIVAIKLIRPELAKNPEVLRRFKQELILARQVTHKNVIRIFDLGQADGFKFITMDFVEGQDLRSLLLKQGKLAPEQAARIMLQICRALEAAHGEGVIHRDLKPQNIMLDANGRVYVMDFGIARSAYLPGMTQTGALIGTPEYMSPEQGRGEKLTECSDIFSLGIIFYELLTGRSPYHSDTPLATLWKRMTEKVTPPVTVDPTLPEPLSNIVVKALEIEPKNRFTSAREMAQQLEVWLGPSAGGETIFLPAPRTFAYWKWASAGLAVLLVAGVIAFRLIGPRKPKAAHPPVSVLVADFTNHTGDPIFDDTVEPMFNVALEGASFINAFSRGKARRLAGQLPHPTDKLDEQPARLVAVSQGIGAVVTGELSQRGDKYSVSATALDAVSGKVITKVEASVENKDQVLLTIPKLTAPIRKALGDTTPESVQVQAMGGAFTAASLEAVHEYGLGMKEQSAGNMQEAFRSFSKTVELDPNFARAWAGMAAIAGNLGQLQDAEKYAKQAMGHVDRMTERERYFIRAMYYIRTQNWPKCVEEYTGLLKQYPADSIGQSNLAACYASLHNMSKAMEEARRAVQLAPKDLMARSNFALDACYAGDFQTCEAEAREVQGLNPSYEEGFLALAHAQLGQGKLAKATATYQALQKLGTRGASLGASGLANLALYEGRYRQAVQILQSGLTADLVAKDPDGAADKFAMLAYAQLSRGEKSLAIAAAEKALANSPTAKTRFLAARAFVDAGETVKAQKLASGLASELAAEPQAYAKIIEGDLALKRGEAVNAVKTLTDANGLLDTWIGRLELARAYLEAASFVAADSELDRCINRRGEAMELFADDMPTYTYVPLVYYYQGRVREGLKSPAFAESYRTYLSIRGQAGEDPLLPEIRRRLGQQ
jgi:tetratricopeptide (TPR) repeat protein